MKRTISLLLLGLLVTAAFAVENGELKRTPASDECAGDGGLESATERAELQRLPSVLLASKPNVRRSPGVEALLQAVPMGESATGPARVVAPAADGLDSESLFDAPATVAKAKLAPAPLPGDAEAPVATAPAAPVAPRRTSAAPEVAAKPVVAPPAAAAVPVPEAVSAPVPIARPEVRVAARPAPAAAPVDAPARIAPVVVEPAAEQHRIAAIPAPAVIQPVAMPMPPIEQPAAYSDCAPNTGSYCYPAYASCPCDDMDGCHGREGWFAHVRRKHCEAKGCCEMFCEPPLGASLYAHTNAQIRKGLGDQTILYQYDFLSGQQANELSPRGLHQLAKIADLMLNTGLTPLVIESSATNPKLDEARRATVLRELKALEPSFADASVVVARPRTHSLRGEEAILIDNNNLQNTQLRGTLLPQLESFSSDDQ